MSGGTAWLWIFILMPFLMLVGMLGLERLENHLFRDRRSPLPPTQSVSNRLASLAIVTRRLVESASGGSQREHHADPGPLKSAVHQEHAA